MRLEMNYRKEKKRKIEKEEKEMNLAFLQLLLIPPSSALHRELK